MNERLFDPEPYGKSRRDAQPSPRLSPMRTVEADGKWWLLIATNGPDERAHMLVSAFPDHVGKVFTKCGLVGRRGDIPRGLAVRPCPACETAER